MNSAGRTTAMPISTIIRPRGYRGQSWSPPVRPDEERLIRLGPLQGAGPPLQDQEVFDHCPDLDPGISVIRFEDKGLGRLLTLSSTML